MRVHFLAHTYILTSFNKNKIQCLSKIMTIRNKITSLLFTKIINTKCSHRRFHKEIFQFNHRINTTFTLSFFTEKQHIPSSYPVPKLNVSLLSNWENMNQNSNWVAYYIYNQKKTHTFWEEEELKHSIS